MKAAAKIPATKHTAEIRIESLTLKELKPNLEGGRRLTTAKPLLKLLFLYQYTSTNISDCFAIRQGQR
ncbi:hypothetical protein [Pseudoalteromonas phenolica]|uniref:hypothetical protein n=1 Tax=Pseudoalteromonas phenolica TaxID=161398 RepID=UPI0019D870D6|nr:hypothetical protein [Pseudoalteromonas phenolica]MBE0355861.1 hypothetical protein [Pseudoalteromonas phenolica O-BC30]